MSLGYVLWILAVVIAGLVGMAKFAGISLPVITPALMKDSTLSMFVALALALAARWV